MLLFISSTIRLVASRGRHPVKTACTISQKINISNWFCRWCENWCIIRGICVCSIIMNWFRCSDSISNLCSKWSLAVLVTIFRILSIFFYDYFIGNYCEYADLCSVWCSIFNWFIMWSSSSILVSFIIRCCSINYSIIIYWFIIRYNNIWFSIWLFRMNCRILLIYFYYIYTSIFICNKHKIWQGIVCVKPNINLTDICNPLLKITQKHMADIVCVKCQI
eukprot:7643_1